MLKINLAIIVALVCLIGFASATVESLGIFKQYDCIDLYQSGIGLTECNITSVKYPNSTYLISSEQVMTRSGTEFNYTICNTKPLGQYIVNGYCGNTTDYVQWAYDLEVTATGVSLTTGKSVLYILFLVASLAIFLLTFYAAMKLPFKNPRNDDGFIVGINNLKYLKVAMMVFSYLIMLLVLGLLRGITASYLHEIGIYGLFEWLYWIMLSLVWPIMVCSLLFILITFLTDKKLTKKLIRGFDIT